MMSQLIYVAECLIGATEESQLRALKYVQLIS
jgi:hypothetical protein